MEKSYETQTVIKGWGGIDKPWPGDLIDCLGDFIKGWSIFGVNAHFEGFGGIEGTGAVIGGTDGAIEDGTDFLIGGTGP